MLSFLCAVWTWLAESADILLDLANAGRDANNAFVIAIVSGLAIIRVTAFLLFMVPPFAWLWRQIVYKDKLKRGETQIRVAVIVLIVVSVVFEIWASPARKSGADAESPKTEIAEQTEGG